MPLSIAHTSANAYQPPFVLTQRYQPNKFDFFFFFFLAIDKSNLLHQSVSAFMQISCGTQCRWAVQNSLQRNFQDICCRPNETTEEGFGTHIRCIMLINADAFFLSRSVSVVTTVPHPNRYLIG